MKSKKGAAMLGKFLFYFGNTLIGIVFVSPLIWMISASFKPEAKIFANMNSLTTFLPTEPSLNNYIEVFRRINMANVFKNTLLYIALILIFDLIINSICGYALAKFEFRGRKLMLSFIYNFFHDIPDDLLEAAAIDGSSPIRTFFTIVMPISKTVYATVFILDFVAHWNDFMWPFLVMTGEDKRTIQLAVQSFFSTSPVHYSAIMAALVISAIPMIIMFIFMQKYYVEGIASSGIKG